MATISNVPQLVGSYFAVAPRLELGKFNKLKTHDIMESVISCETAKYTWTDLVYSFEAKTSKTLSQTYAHYKSLLNELANDGVTLFKHKNSVGFVNSLSEKWLGFSQGLRNDIQENSDDEADERTSEEYLKDLDIEFHEQALLTNSKRFIKRKNIFLFKKQMRILNVTNVAKKDEEKVSDDEEETQVNVLTNLADDELLVGKSHARNGEWIDITMKRRHIRETIWYLDSGCSRSMTSVKSYLHKYVEQPGPKVVFGDNSSCITKEYGSINCDGIVFSKDHLGKFDAKVDDGYFLRYSFNFKAFRVFNTRRKQIKETYNVTFDESIEGIRFTNTSVDEIGIDDSSRYPPDELP
ncbi:hypothetical protein Tco_0655512 [Tanacetum coccineum]|uniref:Retrovirus-related Pol polyprotein from transposon TNT 1-94 n=1 Tax=Tanacetum coccineum TaxID=301880 RepID=A0ABQ4X6Q0_9ASTR